MGNTLASRCLCGAVFASARGQPRSTVNCHCTNCRRATGAAYGTVLYFDDAQVRITGQTTSFDKLSDRGATVTHHFCPSCGSSLFVRAAAFPELIGLRAGCIEETDRVTPQRNVFLKSRISTTPINPDLPGFQAMP